MKFPYATHIAWSSNSPDAILLLRPEIPVTIMSQTDHVSMIGLVDTGSDFTIIPKSAADGLGIPLESTGESPVKVFGGNPVELLIGVATFKLALSASVIQWTTEVSFYEFDSPSNETVILGHAGFLEFFTAVFDGWENELTLEPNANFDALVAT
jgi:predicted aspartyl protease